MKIFAVQYQIKNSTDGIGLKLIQGETKDQVQSDFEEKYDNVDVLNVYVAQTAQ